MFKNKRIMRRVIGYVAALYFVLWGLLIFSERQILVWETVIERGDHSILRCTYFNGAKIIQSDLKASSLDSSLSMQSHPQPD